MDTISISEIYFLSRSNSMDFSSFIQTVNAGLVPIIVIVVYSAYYFYYARLVRQRVSQIYLALQPILLREFTDCGIWQQNGPTEYFLEASGHVKYSGLLVKYNSNLVDLFSVMTREQIVSLYVFIDKDIPLSFGLSIKAIERSDLRYCKSSELKDFKLYTESRVFFDLVMEKHLQQLSALNGLISVVASDVSNSKDSEEKTPFCIEMKLIDTDSLDIKASLLVLSSIANTVSTVSIPQESLKKGIKNRQVVKKPVQVEVKKDKKKVVDDRVRLMGATTGYAGTSGTKKKKTNKFKISK